MQVQNMTSNKGNLIPNQFIINNSKGRYFQSYQSMIVFIPNDSNKPTELGEDWNYSRTTSKYRNDFLNESSEEIKRKLKEGIYILNPKL